MRRAVESDATGLAELLASVGRVVPAADLAARLEAVQQETNAVLIALEWGPPSGLIGLHWYQTITATRPIAQIDVLLVDPEARRRGIGRLLVKAGAQIARQAGCDRLRLRVDPNQRELEAFAAATGFAGHAALPDRLLRKGSRSGEDG